ncbi:MAG: sugar transferase [Planctomycetia bacterium]|nr:sugar transferase [Planctomycetia bacterium]
MHLVYRTPRLRSAQELAVECQEDCLWERPAHSALRVATKNLFDRLVALVAIVMAAPAMGLLAVMVRLSSPGPAIYSQLRIGYQGKLFYFYKFRSMYQDCEKTSGPVWAARNDSRITPLGRTLRMTYLDELPQLFNVLFGQMSLVGPRPERPEITAKLRREFPDGYYKRLLVKPGITGLAQIRQAADLQVEDVRHKLQYDLLYVRRMSLWLDVKLMLGTLTRILRHSQDERRSRRRSHTQRPMDNLPRLVLERNARFNREELINPSVHPVISEPMAYTTDVSIES